MQRVDYVILGAVALVLVIGSLLFLPNGPSEFTMNNAYADGCNELKMKYSCDQYSVTKITAFTAGNLVYSLGNVCATKGYDNTLTCARSCGCNVTGTGIDVAGTPRKVYSNNPILDGVVGDPYTVEPQTNQTGDEYYGV